MARVGKGAVVEMVAKKLGIPKTQAEKSVKAFLETVRDFLAKGDDVAIIGFGTFRLTERAARTGRNPKTGKKMKIPGYKTVTFKVSKNIKEMLNGK